MSSTGLKTIDADDVYCSSLSVSGINIITSLNNLNSNQYWSITGTTIFYNGNIDIVGNTPSLRIIDNSTSRLPSLTLQRGDNIFGNDGYIDWKIQNNGGLLEFISGVTTTTGASILTFFTMNRNICNIFNFLTVGYASTFSSTLNVVGDIVTSGLSVFNINSNLNSFSTNAQLSINNINATSTTILGYINSFSTNAQLSINNLNATSTTIFNNLNSFSTNAQLSINNLNATSTTLFNRTNVNALVVSNASSFLSSLSISTYTYHYNTAYFFNAALQARNAFSLPTASLDGTGKILLDQGSTIGAIYPCDIGVASNAAVPTRVFWYSAPTGATHRFFINGSTCLDIGCNTDNVYRCTIAYPTNINSSLTCSGDIVNTYWRLRNDSDWCRLYNNANTGYFNMAVNNIYTASGSISGANPINIFGMNIGSDAYGTYWTMNGWRVWNFGGGWGSNTIAICSPVDYRYIFPNYSSAGSQNMSDERIKRKIKKVKGDKALEQILLLEPIEYEHLKDKDADLKVGLSAQKVKKHFKHLVCDTNEEFEANILSKGKIDNKIILLEKDISKIIKVGDKIKIVMDNPEGKEIMMNTTDNKYKKRFSKVVNIISNYSFEIDGDIDTNKIIDDIFVFGTLSKDIHTIDYNSVFTLNVSATQELYKLIQQQQIIINDLQNRISILENK